MKTIELGDVVRQPSNDTWWLIYGKRPGGKYGLAGECVYTGSGEYCVGYRDMPFSPRLGEDGVEVLPADLIPDDVLVRATIIKLNGGEVTDETI